MSDLMQMLQFAENLSGLASLGSARSVADDLTVLAIFLLAGMVKGVVGLGLPTISMALLALIMPPAQAAALLIIPSFVTNVWQAGPLRSLAPLLGRIGGMQAGVAAGTLAGAALFGAPAGAWASMALGAALIGYAAWGFLGKPLHMTRGQEKWWGPITGALTGIVTAGTGVFVIPAVPYLQALALPRDELVQAMGISFTVSTLALALGLWGNDSYSAAEAGTSVLLLFPALAGMAAGQRLRRMLRPVLFRHCLMTSLAALGSYQVLEHLM